MKKYFLFFFFISYYSYSQEWTGWQTIWSNGNHPDAPKLEISFKLSTKEEYCKYSKTSRYRLRTNIIGECGGDIVITYQQCNSSVTSTEPVSFRKAGINDYAGNWLPGFGPATAQVIRFEIFDSPNATNYKPNPTWFDKLKDKIDELKRQIKQIREIYNNVPTVKRADPNLISYLKFIERAERAVKKAEDKAKEYQAKPSQEIENALKEIETEIDQTKSEAASNVSSARNYAQNLQQQQQKEEHDKRQKAIDAQNQKVFDDLQRKQDLLKSNQDLANKQSQDRQTSIDNYNQEIKERRQQIENKTYNEGDDYPNPRKNRNIEENIYSVTDYYNYHNNPSYPLAQSYKAYKESNYDEIIQSNKNLLLYNPNNLTAINNIGFAYYQKGNLKDAEEYFLQGLTINPSHELIKRNLNNLYIIKANVLVKEKDFNSAIEYYNKVLKGGNAERSIYNNLAYSYSQNGDIENAKKYYRNAADMGDTSAKQWLIINSRK